LIETIPANWKRVGGLATKDDGTVGVVWIAIEPESKVVTVWDTVLWEKEVFDLIASRITSSNGRYTPIAWSNKAYADELTKRGVRMLPEPVSVDPAVAAAKTTEIWELIRRKQFFAKRWLTQWSEEYKAFQRQKGKVPLGESPLMEATWYAVSAIPYARAEQSMRSGKPLYPKIAMV
jgi:hypothetical protein